MTYAYENLGAERFQELCQAILVPQHPQIQCLPVGQPDGGRDAVLWRSHMQRRSDSVVFQIKFSKNPSQKDERSVIEELIRTEAHKVSQLKQRGLEKYYLLTNVGGTSHYESGSIDRVNEVLSEEFAVEAYCWWRDDLDRRIDGNSSLKWSYPEILRGTDILQGLYEGRFGEEQARRMNAIKAYLAYQYKYDSQLKFKQVDLEKGLVDLFVDVPAEAIGPKDHAQRQTWLERFHITARFASLLRDSHRSSIDDDVVGALIDPVVTKAFPRVVIEGAPGQGKSTVTQFLCQLHRMVLLDKKFDRQKVPIELQLTDVRLPIRVDLRDYATWISGRSPFQEGQERVLPEGCSPALESFLAAQISAQSGGVQFSTDDLLAFAAQSALLIVLDGFDEVADISVRNRLVQEISDASTRFEGNAISNQVIVTSRPAAFANSPGFPREDWQYIQILPLSKNVISTYTNKWISGHNLDQRERSDIVSVLSEKLEYPHVRELARNPMQLAILLALISTQGASLPDKRTTLYDRYIDIFFNRESEKSKVVRDKRELLIDMHRYLAWTLQVEVESDAKAGNISEAKLRDILRSYLSDLGHDTALVDTLFAGMVERVVALVSRVQGTFEFEVQPLREYFAARYLYDTTPYIPAGSTRCGSIMDRFDALARNAYWLNVTRFYCGCYSSGEIASLVDGIIHIGQSEQYSSTNYVVDLAITLLSDYVFSQQPRSVARLTNFLFEPNRFRMLLARVYGSRHGDTIALPDGSGKAVILGRAIEAFGQSRHLDTAFSSSAIIKSNLMGRTELDIWAEVRDEFFPSQALFFASYLDVVEHMAVEEVISLINDGGDAAVRIAAYRERFDALMSAPAIWRRLLDLSLNGHGSWANFARRNSASMCSSEVGARTVLATLGALHSLDRNSDQYEDLTLIEFYTRVVGGFPGEFEDFVRFTSEIRDENSLSKDICDAANRVFNSRVSRNEEFLNEISNLLEALVSDFGCRVNIILAANSVVHYFGGDAGEFRFSGLLSDLHEMGRNASQTEWWKRKLNSQDVGGELLTALGYLVHADANTVAETISDFSRFLDRCLEADYRIIHAARSVRYSPYSGFHRDPLTIGVTSNHCGTVGVRGAAILSQWVSVDDRNVLYENVLRLYDGEDDALIETKFNSAWLYACSNPGYWEEALKVIADSYRKGAGYDKMFSLPERGELPLSVAKAINAAPLKYPLPVIEAAERTLSQKIGSQVVPVGSIAASEQWFIDS